MWSEEILLINDENVTLPVLIVYIKFVRQNLFYTQYQKYTLFKLWQNNGLHCHTIDLHHHSHDLHYLVQDLHHHIYDLQSCTT